MAPTYTEQLDLPIWNADDTFTREGMNSINESIESKLGYMGREFIKTYTADDINGVTQIQFPLDDIEWALYRHVYFDIRITSDNNIELGIITNLNEQRCITPSRSNVTTDLYLAKIAVSSIPTLNELWIYSNYNPAAAFHCSANTSLANHLGYIDCSDGTLANGIDELIFKKMDTGSLVNAEITINIWGVR